MKTSQNCEIKLSQIINLVQNRENIYTVPPIMWTNTLNVILAYYEYMLRSKRQHDSLSVYILVELFRTSDWRHTRQSALMCVHLW